MRKLIQRINNTFRARFTKANIKRLARKITSKTTLLAALKIIDAFKASSMWLVELALILGALVMVWSAADSAVSHDHTSAVVSALVATVMIILLAVIGRFITGGGPTGGG